MIRVNEEAHREIKVAAAKVGVTAGQVVEALAEGYLPGWVTEKTVGEASPKVRGKREERPRGGTLCNCGASGKQAHLRTCPKGRQS